MSGKHLKGRRAGVLWAKQVATLAELERLTQARLDCGGEVWAAAVEPDGSWEVWLILAAPDKRTADSMKAFWRDKVGVGLDDAEDPDFLNGFAEGAAFALSDAAQTHAFCAARFAAWDAMLAGE